MMMKNILKTVTSSQKRDCCADEQEHWHLIRGKILCIYQQVWAHFLMLTLRFILEFAWAAYTTLATNEKPVPGSLPVGGANATVAKNETNMDADKAYQGWTHLFFLGLLWILFLYAWTLSLWNLLMLRKLWRWHPNRERALLPGVIRSLQQAYLPLLITMILCGVVLLPSIALYGCNWKSGIDSKGCENVKATDMIACVLVTAWMVVLTAIILTGCSICLAIYLLIKKLKASSSPRKKVTCNI